jgi:hypothetical protein
MKQTGEKFDTGIPLEHLAEEQDLQELNEEVATQFSWVLDILPSNEDLLKSFDEPKVSTDVRQRIDDANLLALKAEMAYVCDSISRRQLSREELSSTISAMLSHFAFTKNRETSIAHSALEGLMSQLTIRQPAQ